MADTKPLPTITHEALVALAHAEAAKDSPIVQDMTPGITAIQGD